MKLTKHTLPQARNYQCNTCKGIFCHADMVNEDICYSCQDKQTSHNAPKEKLNGA